MCQLFQDNTVLRIPALRKAFFRYAQCDLNTRHKIKFRKKQSKKLSTFQN